MKVVAFIVLYGLLTLALLTVGGFFESKPGESK